MSRHARIDDDPTAPLSLGELAALADAAQAAGFADQSHMTRLFYRTYGMSRGIYTTAMN